MYIDRRRRSLEFNSKQQPFPEPLFHIAIPTMETNFLRGLIGVRGGSALDFVLVK
uniref:Uncharacterized protein n=1 Tax=Octopus bimaculoides TaxID=37653 RepID=A0A0L8FP34_OCTBM